ncbi:MAG TPA: hypothetical protein DE061_01055 [Clostridiales bacterium]|nr:hypothetical protein [Clostridiales bacterium]
MKRKMLSVLLVVLVVCLAASMLVLSACNPKEDDKPEPQKPSTERSTTDMMNDIWANIQNSYQLGEKFGVDVSASFVIDDKTAKDNDVTFTLTAKGNADLQDGATDDKTAFVLELTKKAKTDEKATTILGLAYEVIENQPYFFGNVMGEYRKINGYSLTALYRAIAKKDASAAAFDMSSITEYIPMVIGAFFGSTGTVENNVYTLKFDLADLASSLEELWGSVGSVALGALNITQEQLDGYVKQFFGDLTYETRGGEAKVESLDDLFAYLQRAIGFEGTLAFKFDQNNKFESANISFDYAKNDVPVANYTLKVDKAVVGMVSTPVDTWANFALDADARKNNEAINLLKFSVNGSATGLDDKGEAKHNYEIDVQADIEPFALLNLVNNTSKENIVATLKQLGYFHLEINEVFSNKDPLNIITLHSNFAEGFAVVNVHTYGAIIYKAGVGGVYDFDALVDVIDMLINKPSEPGGEQPGEETSIVDTIKNVVNTVKEYLAFFNADNMKENGVTVQLKDLVFHLLDALGVDTKGIIGTGVGAVLGSDSMNVKLQTPVYGQCEKVATDSIVCTIREASAFKDGKNDFIKEIKSVDGVALKAYKGTDINNYSSAAALDLGKAFRITGKNLKGEDVVTSGYIMGVKGLDLSKVGKQNVTLYVAIANDVLDLSKAGLALGDDIPIAGALKFETEFEVLDPQTVTAENISLVNTKTPTNTILYTKEIFEQVTSDNPYMNINGIYRPIGESDMKVVDANGNAVELVDGKIAKGGAYKVYFETAGFKSDYIEISVVSAYAKRTDGHKEVEQLVLGEVWNYDPYEVWVVTKDGETKVDNATAKFTLGSATGLNNIFDITKDANGKDVYTLKKNLDFAGKNLTITFSRLTIAGNKYQTVKAEIPVVCADGYTVSKAINSNYITNTLNGGFEITQNGVAYSVVWNGTAFEAVAADGSKLADFSMSLTWATRKIAVELDKQGCITNIANKNMASLRTEKIACEIKVGDYTYTDDFTFNELYASNKSFGVEVGATLDGYIGNVNKLYYVDANGEQQELEFKNGKDGYAIYVKDTDTKVYDVTVTVTKDNAAVELVEGAFAETGKYRVSYTVNVNGIDQTFYHDVTVK